MYEVLALSMEVAGRPKQDVQRVLLSLTDFGPASVESMTYSAAYLTRFGRDEAALRLYRQASRMAPDRSEPYILGLKLARKLKQTDDLSWAVAGVLRYGWTTDYARIHRDAENAALEAEERLARTGDAAAAKKLRETVAQAKLRDLKIVLEWNGTADLDLIVEEPTGTVCSFESPETLGGGIHLHDGFGPSADNCTETYVCPEAVAGEYRVRVKRASGAVVGRLAYVTITKHVGSPNEAVVRKTVVLADQDGVVSFTLDQGRRKQPRTVSTRRLDSRRALHTAQASRFLNRPRRMTPDEQAAFRRFQESRELSRRQNLAQVSRPFVTGAVGFQPVVTTIPEGSLMTASAVVSPDRRYVRIAVNPVFTTLTDVFTFSFVSGFDPFGGRNTGLGGN